VKLSCFYCAREVILRNLEEEGYPHTWHGKCQCGREWYVEEVETEVEDSEEVKCWCCKLNPAEVQDYRDDVNGVESYWVCQTCLHLDDDLFYELHDSYGKDRLDLLRDILSDILHREDIPDEEVESLWKALNRKEVQA